MDIIHAHPRKQLVHVMNRIYDAGMTTTSGGNLSTLDDNGDIWITPGGTDKGKLKEEDIVLVRCDGSIEGKLKASSELPFHRAIYKRCPHLKAILHAHPPGLVSYSIVRLLPDLDKLPMVAGFCGSIGYAPYQMPGSEALGQSLASDFGKGHMALIMENHGTVVAGTSILDAYYRFEMLEFAAASLIKCRILGRPLTPQGNGVHKVLSGRAPARALADADNRSEKERDVCRSIAEFAQRASKKKLMLSNRGCIALRGRDHSFFLTPPDRDRQLLEASDIGQIRKGDLKQTKTSDPITVIMDRVFAENPEINCILFAHAPNLTAFALTGQQMDTRSIPESFVLLREIPHLPYSSLLADGASIAATLSTSNPMLFIDNDGVMVSGGSMLETFDRLEVAEFSARSLIQSRPLGKLQPIGEAEIKELKEKYLS